MISPSRWLTSLALAAAVTSPALAQQRAGPPAGQQTPDSFLVRLTTNRGPVTILVYRAWAPLGVDRLYQLIRAGFYDQARFFRVLPRFVAQFGLPADPHQAQPWRQAIPDDPVRQSNLHGTVTFATAGPNTRTTQLFINLADNPRLDALGFAPLGRVTQGLPIVDALNGQYGESPSQDEIEKQGNAYLKRTFPKLDYIVTARVVRKGR
ncbi:MAG TPA: peptidylprolyl isomerase [Gemmatimonadales bacterium]|nr:peptidylprolyl isomerase [Gemmatimonadales bacterium]